MTHDFALSCVALLRPLDLDNSSGAEQSQFGSRRLPNAVLERCQPVFFQEDETLEVVTGRFQMQGERRAHDPQAAHQFAAHLSQRAKHMFDASARRGDSAIAPLLGVGNSFGRMAAALDVYAPASLLQPGLPFNAGVTTVRINVTTGVAQVEQLLEDAGVGHGGMRDGDLADELVTLVDAGVQLVAKVVLAVLSGPLCVNVLLRTLVRLPTQRHRAFFDRFSLFSLVALNRSLDQRSVDDLAAARQIALRQQLLLDLLEYAVADASLGQAVAEQPDRFGVGELLLSVISRKRRKLRRSSN